MQTSRMSLTTRGNNNANRQSKRYSVAAMYMSMGGVDRDDDINDELAKAQRALRKLKNDISETSKENFVLEKDVRYLDGRIALLIQNKMAPEEQNEVASRIALSGAAKNDVTDEDEEYFLDRKQTELYGNLFFLLQSEPAYIARLCRLVSLAEIDSLLQTVMFTIYGNQYEQREEHLLLTMFQEVLAAQFDQASEFSSLLRANTPVSRMMTTYSRRGPGQTYLRSSIAPAINRITERRDLNLEINPSKVYDQVVKKDAEDDMYSLDANDMGLTSITLDEIERHPKILNIIRGRQQKLKELANGLVDAIIASLDSVPYGIRWICKQIRLLTRRKYPAATDTAVCSLIGAFFFLRFVNPAIVTPQSYMLVDKPLNDDSRRTLTLIAKLLQNLANKPTYSKEPYMESLSGFVDSNKARINKFLNNLCEVSDFNESLEMDQYVVLSKTDLTLDINLNEIFGMQSLLLKYKDGVSLTNETHLSMLLDDLGPCPPLVPRSRNASIVLPISNKWAPDVGDIENEYLAYLRADVIFMEAKSLMINIIRAYPPRHPILKLPYDLRKIADHASKSKETGIMTRGIKAYALLEEIAESDSEDFELLDKEITYELKHLGSLQESVEREAVSLKEVYALIKEHSEYLTSQLDIFRSYLENVRMHTGNKDRPVGLDPETDKKKTKHKLLIKKYSLAQLKKEKVLYSFHFPADVDINSLQLQIASPIPGTFVISLLMKSRDDPLLSLDLKLDDLLELFDKNCELLDLKCIVIAVRPLLGLLKGMQKRK